MCECIGACWRSAASHLPGFSGPKLLPLRLQGLEEILESVMLGGGMFHVREIGLSFPRPSGSDNPQTKPVKLCGQVLGFGVLGIAMVQSLNLCYLLYTHIMVA